MFGDHYLRVPEGVQAPDPRAMLGARRPAFCQQLQELRGVDVRRLHVLRPRVVSMDRGYERTSFLTGYLL